MLHVTLSGALSGTYELDYSGAFLAWDTGPVVVGCGGVLTQSTLNCAAGTWHITIGLAGANINAGSSTCDPIFFVFTVLTTCGNVTAIVTV